MSNLPISTNIAPAQIPGKPASPDDAAAQGTQGFGEVLAHQVADTAAPAGKKADAAPADAAPLAILTDSAASLAPAISNALPTDMLAALLAQQNQSGTAQPAPNLQLVVNNQIQAGKTDAPLAAVAGNDARASRLALPENTDLSQALAGPSQAAPSAAKDSMTFADTLKSMGKNEVIPALSGESARNISLAELATSAQQSGATALASAQAVPVIRNDAISVPLAVTTPLTHAGWGDEFSQKITWLATQRDQSAELHLNPPHLGPLDVVIKVSADQATALFTSPHAAVREAIEQALPRLREMLADSGIMLGNATVSDQASRREQNDFARAQQGSGTVSGRAGEVATPQEVHVTPLSRHNGRVDTFA